MMKRIRFSREYFDIAATLESGQVFRYCLGQSASELFSKGKRACLWYEGNEVVIESEDDEYFFNLFALDVDYGKIVKQLEEFGELRPFLHRGKGVRVLRLDEFETIISFIVSANNNIKRIRKILEELCKNYGQSQDNFYAFPTPNEMAKISEQEYKSIGCGYRAAYLAHTAAKLQSGEFLSTAKCLPTKSLRNALMSLKGVGRKVADCILLFAFERAVFPTDTWIERFYRQVFESEFGAASAQNVSNFLSQRYGDLAGYAQQFVFYSIRNME